MTLETRSRKALWFPPYSLCRIALSGSWLPPCEDTHTALWRGPCEEEMRPAANSQVSSVQFSSVTQRCLTLCNPMDCSMPGFPVHHQLPELAQTHVHRVSDATQASHPLSSLLLPSVFLSIRVFPNESVLRIRWPKYQSFSLNLSPSNEHPGLISFRMDWWDLHAVQGTLKSLLQHHSSKASTLRHSVFFIVQLTTIHDHRKNHSLD